MFAATATGTSSESPPRCPPRSRAGAAWEAPGTTSLVRRPGIRRPAATKPAPVATTREPDQTVDVVLVGLPGSGKSAVGRRLAHRHGASFVDLDESIEKTAGRTIPEIFADDGEGRVRGYEREAGAALGPPDTDPALRRVVATGGGAVIDPRNRWHLYRDRLPIWLDGRPEVLAQRLRRSPNVRPLMTGRDPMGTIR